MPTRRLPVGLLLSALLFCRLSSATLGESETDSVDKDSKVVAGTREATIHKGSIRVHPIRSAHLKVREFATSKDGKIFGLSVEGKTLPDLQPFLGAYFQEYAAAHQRVAKLRTRRPFRVIQTDHFIVKRFGHMGHLQLKVYLLPLPEGVSENDLQ